MKAFFFVVDEALANVASAQALNIHQLTGCQVHIFVERSDSNAVVSEITWADGITYHYDVLRALLPEDLPSSQKWPSIVYLRIFAPFFLQNYERLIYLDADIHCRHFDNRIWCLDLPHGLAAVHDLVIAISEPLGLKMDRRDWLDSIGVSSDRYFNSGFLLIDVKQWCQIDFDKELTKYFDTYEHRVYMFDQDFLNFIFQKKWVELSPQWNFQDALFRFGYEEFFDPIFYHYSRYAKPWFGLSGYDEDGYFLYKSLFERANLDIAAYRRKRTWPGIFIWLKQKLRQKSSKFGLVSRKEKRLRKRWKINKLKYDEFFRQSLGRNYFALEDRSEFYSVDLKLRFTGNELIVDR